MASAWVQILVFVAPFAPIVAVVYWVMFEERNRRAAKMLVRLEDTMPGNGVKDDVNKLKMHLLPRAWVPYVVRILMFGAGKYSPDNWRRLEITRLEDAMERHFMDYKNGVKEDPETGENPFFHFLTNAIMVADLLATKDTKNEN